MESRQTVLRVATARGRCPRWFRKTDLERKMGVIESGGKEGSSSLLVSP